MSYLSLFLEFVNLTNQLYRETFVIHGICAVMIFWIFPQAHAASSSWLFVVSTDPGCLFRQFHVLARILRTRCQLPNPRWLFNWHRFPPGVKRDNLCAGERCARCLIDLCLFNRISIGTFLPAENSLPKQAVSRTICLSSRRSRIMRYRPCKLSNGCTDRQDWSHRCVRRQPAH